MEKTGTNQRQLDPHSGLKQLNERRSGFFFSGAAALSVPDSLGILLLSQMQLKTLKPMGVYVGVEGLEQIVRGSEPSGHADTDGWTAFLQSGKKKKKRNYGDLPRLRDEMEEKIPFRL